MANKAKKRNTIQEVWEEDVFDSYLQEMNELVRKYPEDPNKTDFSEQELTRLIKNLDLNWKSFQKKWQRKLGKAEKVFGSAYLKKGKEGLRHLIIKSEFAGDEVLDLSVADPEEKK
jgi:hypothetical protein